MIITIIKKYSHNINNTFVPFTIIETFLAWSITWAAEATRVRVKRSPKNQYRSRHDISMGSHWGEKGPKHETARLLGDCQLGGTVSPFRLLPSTIGAQVHANMMASQPIAIICKATKMLAISFFGSYSPQRPPLSIGIKLPWRHTNIWPILGKLVISYGLFHQFFSDANLISPYKWFTNK